MSPAVDATVNQERSQQGASKEESSWHEGACRRIPHRPYYYTGNNDDNEKKEKNETSSPRYRSRLLLPRTAAMVGLGCSSFSGFFAPPDDDEMPPWIHEARTTDVATIDSGSSIVRQWVATIHYAICEAGITLLDTAPWYGYGVSEQVVGLALQELFQENGNDKSHHDDNKNRRRNNITRQDVILNTKVGRYDAEPACQFDFSRQATLASVQRSLQRLQTNYIDVLQLHDPEFAPTLAVLLHETIPALLECRQKGWCRALGLTGYPLAVQRQIFQATLEHFGDNLHVWDQALTYGHYNLHDQTLFRQPASILGQDNTAVMPMTTTRSFWEFCRQHQCICLAAAPLSMGLFTSHDVPDWHPASTELRVACQQAARICNNYDVNVTELALLVALAEPRIPVTILGMKDVSQVQVVQRLCHRLQQANFVLPVALTDQERRAWEILSDPVQGPFAKVWDTNQYHWDGVQQVREFWQTVPGQKVEEWQVTA